MKKMVKNSLYLFVLVAFSFLSITLCVTMDDLSLIEFLLVLTIAFVPLGIFLEIANGMEDEDNDNNNIN